jgi:hypothetical protein
VHLLHPNSLNEPFHDRTGPRGGFNIYDSFKTDASSLASTPHVQAGRFMAGMLRDQKYNTHT